MTKAIAVSLCTLVLVACGGTSSGGNAPSATDNQAFTGQQIATKLGCSNPFRSDGPQFYTRIKGHCDGVRGNLEIALFNGNEARDNWLQAAKGMGSVVLAGNQWVVFSPSPAAIRTAQQKLGGEIH